MLVAFIAIMMVVIAMKAGPTWIRNSRNGTASTVFTEQFLTPDLSGYRWERMGEYPESISWTAEGIVIDPPTGSTAYLSVPATGTAGAVGSLPSRPVGPLGRLLWSARYQVAAVDVDLVVQLLNAYVMVLEWGSSTVQATPEGFLVTVIQPGPVHVNRLVRTDPTKHHRISVSKNTGFACIAIDTERNCQEVLPHSNDIQIWIGESRKNTEHGGSMVIRQITTSIEYI